MAKYGPGRFECTAPSVPQGRDKHMFRAQQPGESDAEYNELKGKAQARFDRLQSRKGGLERARKSGPRTSDDLDDNVGPWRPGSDQPK